jgi:hypothetical protein
MGPNGVVLLSPSFDHHLGILEGVEYLTVEQSISQFPIEPSFIAILPGLPGSI